MTKAKLLTKDQVGTKINGSSLQGYLQGVTYNDLVNTFGEPTFNPDNSGDGKVNYEWVFEYGGEIFTVYDWKVSQDYARHIIGREGELQFHVGGHINSGEFETYVHAAVAKNN